MRSLPGSPCGRTRQRFVGRLAADTRHLGELNSAKMEVIHTLAASTIFATSNAARGPVQSPRSAAAAFWRWTLLATHHADRELPFKTNPARTRAINESDGIASAGLFDCASRCSIGTSNTRNNVLCKMNTHYHVQASACAPPLRAVERRSLPFPGGAECPIGAFKTTWEAKVGQGLNSWQSLQRQA